MKYTLKEIIEDEIAAYRPFGVNDGIYRATFGDGTKIEIWSCDDDPNPEEVSTGMYATLPKDGWLHLDDCNCPDCEDAS